MWSQKLMRVAWPAFLSACILELLVFAVVDPFELRWAGQALGWPRTGVYTAGFFVFWAVGAASCALTALLGMPPAEVNCCPLASGERPDGCPQQ